MVDRYSGSEIERWKLGLARRVTTRLVHEGSRLNMKREENCEKGRREAVTDYEEKYD